MDIGEIENIFVFIFAILIVCVLIFSATILPKIVEKMEIENKNKKEKK